MLKLVLGILTMMAGNFANAMVDIEVGVLYRQDDIDWHIGKLPVDILSELEWQNVNTRQSVLVINTHLPWRLKFAAYYAQGEISSGTTYDADYNGNKAGLYSLSKSDVQGELTSLRLEISKAYQIKHIIGSVGVGWSKQQQQLTMFNGFQLVPDYAPYYGAFNGLHNSYDIEWQGKFLTATLGYQYDDWQLDLSTTHHFWRYEAEADWNLRKEFAHPVSFEHLTNATAWEGNLTLSYQVNKQYSIKTFYNLISAKGDNGIDTTYFKDETIQHYFLNQVNWQSTQYGIALNYKF